MPTTAERLDHLEDRALRAEGRLRRLERSTAVASPAEVPWATIPTRAEFVPVGTVVPARVALPRVAPAHVAPTHVASALTAAVPRPSLEELLGGRVLAWVGGAAVLLGLVFLFALGISNGWIGEAERCAIAAAGCVILLVAGVWLHARAGRTEAARAAAATGIAGLFLTLTVATAEYGVLPGAVGLTAATGVGALAVVLAVAWAAPVIAALGIVGALLAPALAGAAGESTGLAFLAVAAGAAVAVVVWQRWTWVSACVALVVTPQWVGWLLSDHDVAPTLLVLVVFGMVQATAAVGATLRGPQRDLGALAALLLATNALVLGLAGWTALLDVGSRTVAVGWLAGLAAAHVALGVAARRSSRAAGDLGLLSLALGVVLADVAFATVTGGATQALGWAAGAVAFAALSRTADACRRDQVAAVSGLGLHVALAVLSAAQAVDTATLLTGGAPNGTAVVMLAALAAACLISARLAPAYRLILDFAGLAAAAVLAALALDGVALTAIWALEAAALCSLGVRGTRDRTAWFAGLVHLGLAAAWCLADQAPPTGLVDGVADLGAAGLGIAAVLAALVRIALLVAPARRAPAYAGLALGTLLIVSLAVVDLGGTDVRAAQLRLSGLWALVGVGALVAGLRLDVAAVRAGALGLLGVTIAKVFVYDLATQEAVYRVASFLGLGVLLLGAAFAYQRLRPAAGPQNPGGRVV